MRLPLFVTFLWLFACDGKDKVCDREGCGSYHGGTSTTTAEQTVEGFVAVGERRLQENAKVHQSGTVDFGKHARLAIDPPDPEDEGEHDLDDTHAELWFCPSPAAELGPMAGADGLLTPGCFEAGLEATPATIAPLEGTLVVRPPPVSLDDLHADEPGFAFHYLLVGKAPGVEVDIDVSAWSRTKIESCGEFY